MKKETKETKQIRLLRMHSWLLTLIEQLERIADELHGLAGLKTVAQEDQELEL